MKNISNATKWLVASSAACAMSAAHGALDVFGDFDGDTAHDAGYSTTPGSTFTMKVYAAEDGLHGGLISYGVELMLQAGLAIAGATDAARMANIVSDAQWDLPETKRLSPRIDVVDATFLSSFTGTVHLFDVTLAAPATPGAYTVSFKNVEPDATFDGFLGMDGFVYDTTNVFKSTTVTVVPEPDIALMMVLGLGGIGALRWWRRRPLR